jgi:SAM-dependent methyltransferase
MTVAHDPFASGAFPLCASTHDLGVRRLFDLATILLLLDCRPGDRVLDLGAGPGFSSETMARLGYDVVALDPDRVALTHNLHRHTLDASRIDGRTSATAGAAEQLPFSGGVFDGALGMNVLHHVADLGPVVDELARVLKPGAHAVFCEPGLDHLASRETQRAIAEHGESDRAFDVFALLTLALERGFAAAMMPATLQSALSLLPIQEVELYASGAHPRAHLTPRGILDELRQRHAYAMLIRAGEKPRTSRYPSRLRYDMTVAAVPEVVAAGEVIRARVIVRNTGDTVWLAAPRRYGGFVTAGCKILTSDGRLVTDALGRSYLPADVAPGASVEIDLLVPLPDTLTTGRHELQFDLVDELMFWFSDVGNTPERRAISVR